MVRTWTHHTSKCRACGRVFRISKEAIEETRSETPDGKHMSDADIADTIDFCLYDATGEKAEGEYVS